MTSFPDKKKESFFENIYDNYSAPLYGLIWGISHNTEQAEEILIQTFRSYFQINVMTENNHTVFIQLLRITICIASEKTNLPKHKLVKLIFTDLHRIKQCS
ncbi:MAG: hypothetical protein JWR61_5599 [Ferruginibacter sp.]|nr:hypothetical protein [Ferruginibacter sp.]